MQLYAADGLRFHLDHLGLLAHGTSGQGAPTAVSGVHDGLHQMLWEGLHTSLPVTIAALYAAHARLPCFTGV
jgi:hypothetical protein